MPHGIIRRLFGAAPRHLLGTITHVETQDAVVALTFDDGPHPIYTPRLLETLERYRARATFFMIGATAKKHPDVVRRVASAGHAIGNHSWDHPSFPLITGRERRIQLHTCAKALAPYSARLFRPPYCDQTIASTIDAFLLGYKIVAYSVATDDWRGDDATSIAEQVEDKIRPGSVIVLHDRLFDASEQGYFDREAVLEAVRIVLDRLSGRFRFVTVPELLQFGKPHKELWLKQPDVELLNQLQREKGPGRRYWPDEKNNSLTSVPSGFPK